jgi:hypothetical protein
VEVVELLYYWIDSGFVKNIEARIGMKEMKEIEMNGFVEGG